MHVFIGQAFSTLTIYKKPINGQRPSFTKSSAKKSRRHAQIHDAISGRDFIFVFVH